MRHSTASGAPANDVTCRPCLPRVGLYILRQKDTTFQSPIDQPRGPGNRKMRDASCFLHMNLHTIRLQDRFHDGIDRHEVAS